ncbi:hypothetical protein BX600DRAFT_414574 [Xylariales sp. PMI_506]|nr:hypothetical protein BX600DRAFT_414574 [Xylariales sp. PMI_506]
MTKDTAELRLATAKGYETRKILLTPVRNALPSEIPLIDISPIFSDDLADRQAVAQKIRHAASNNGFFYIQNHGISREVTDKTRSASLDFFRQDMSIKTKTGTNGDESYLKNGYLGPGTQSLNADEGIDIRESYSVRYEPWFDVTIPDPANIPPDAAKYYPEQGNSWGQTENLPQFKTFIIQYFQECLALARALTRSFALSLNLAEDFFDSKVRYPEASIDLNYYPSIVKGAQLDKTGVSVGSHTDWQLFTILWQDDVGGLQVLNKDGQWIWAPPVNNTLVINIADYMQRLTNDMYVSSVHRARNLSGQERISIPFFWGFGLNESCDVLDECVKEGEEKRYDKIKCGEWVRLKGLSILRRQ